MLSLRYHFSTSDTQKRHLRLCGKLIVDPFPQKTSDCLDHGRGQEIGQGEDLSEKMSQTPGFKSWRINGMQVSK
jgi:hypothetical protein